MILAGSKILHLTVHPHSVPSDAIVINRGIIKAVGSISQMRNIFPGHRIHFLQNAVLMPGLVNVHTHLELPLLLDRISDRSFSKWVLNLIRAKKNLTHDDYTAAAQENISALIQTGTTTVGEICTHDVSPPLLKQRGLRAVVFKELIRMGSPAGDFRTGRFLTQGRNSALVSRGVSPHSPYTVSESILGMLAEWSSKNDIRLAMHVAESKDELKLFQRRKSGLEMLYQFAKWDIEWAPRDDSSFEYLHRIGLLSPRLLAVHAVQTADVDIQLIKKAKAPIAHCPRSNGELVAGRMPLRKMLDAGITVGLGTDSLASVPTLSMWDEMRYALKTHRNDGITAEDIFKIATIGGAKALGLDGEIGTLTPGKKADIIAVPLPKKNTGDLCSDLLRETKSSIMTMVNGRILHLKK